MAATPVHAKANQRWTEEEKEYVKKHFATTETAEIAEKLNRSPSAVSSLALRMGLRKAKRPNNFWSKAEKEFLKNNYKKLGNKIYECEELKKRSKNSIQRMIYNLELKERESQIQRVEKRKQENKTLFTLRFDEIEKYVPGEKVILKFVPRLTPGCKNGRIEKATVIKVYKHHVLFQIGKRKESVQKVDIAIGEVQVLKESKKKKERRKKKK